MATKGVGTSSEYVQWNDAAIKELKTLWAEGHSMAEIGRRMQTSKNSIVGKVHRLGLPSRPSPVIRDAGVPKPQAVRKATPRTVLPVLPSVAAPEPQPAPFTLSPARISRVEPCCWPIGEPGTKAFRYCDNPSLGGRVPYCAAHHAAAGRKRAVAPPHPAIELRYAQHSRLTALGIL